MKKSIASRILAALMAVCLIAQPAFASSTDTDVEVSAPAEEYVFVSIPANATIETDGWKLSIEESAPGFYFNRASTGWYDNKTDNSLLQLNATRSYIGYDVNVKIAGNYTLTVTTSAATSADINVFVNGAQAGTMTSGNTTHEVNSSVYFKEGINTIRFEGTSSIRLSKINLAWAGEYTGAHTYDFTSGAVNSDIHKMSFERNGMRFSNDLSSGLYAGYTKFNTNGYASVCFNERVGNYAGFDMMVNAAGTYDMIVNAENNANHSAEVEAIVNGTTNKAAGGTTVGTFDTSHLKARKGDNHRTVHLAGAATLNEGYNVLQFKSVGTKMGVNCLYFREGVSLADTTAAATVAGSEMSFVKGTTVNVTAQAPAHGLYYLYIKGKVADDAFGGNVAAGGLTQYIDFNTAYYGEAAGTEVTRVVGPIWMNANKDVNVSFTENCADATALSLSSIELHEVKQNFWTVDNATQNYDGVTVEKNGWELNAKTTISQYKMMMLGSQVLSGVNQVSYFNTHRDQNATNINLINGQVMFDIYVPASGNYTLSGVFSNRALSNNPRFVINTAGVDSTISLYQAEGNEFKSSDIAVAYFEKGVHTITIGGGEYPTNDSKYLYMKNLTLTPYEGAVADSASVALDNAALKVNDTATATTSVFVGEDAYEGEYTVAYASSNNEVATVDADGVVTAIAEGEATITATVRVLGKKFVATCTLTVEAAEEPEPEVLLGDANGDGKLNTRDVVTLRKYISTQDATDVNVPALDTTGDGKINARDVGALRTIIANS